MNRKRLFLIDGMALAYRAFFTFINNPLRNAKGENTSAIYGFTNAVLKILNDEKPDYIAVAFDTPEPTFRHTRFSDYKATREKMPEEMGPQLPRLKELAEAMGIRVIEKPGFEADDIIGTLATVVSREGIDIYMVTADKDFMQLINDRIFIYNPIRKDGKPEIAGTADVIAKFGVPANQVIEILGLMGDTSDNIPGVKGIGEKTAAKLIGAYGTIQNLYSRLSEIKGKVRENLERDRENAFLSRELAIIKTDIPLDIRLDEMTKTGGDPQTLAALLEEFGFKSLVQRLDTASKSGGARSQQAIAEAALTLVKDESDFERAMSLLTKSSQLGIRAIGSSPDPIASEVLGLAVSDAERRAYFFTKALLQGDVLRKLHSLFSSDKTLIMHDAKYSLHLMGRFGLTADAKTFDTMIAAHMATSDRQLDLAHLVEVYANLKLPLLSNLREEGKTSQSPLDLTPDALSRYTGQEAAALVAIAGPLQEKLNQIESRKPYDEIEEPLIRVLTTMESHGVWLDINILKEMSEDFGCQVQELEKAVYREAGAEFNLNSPQQLGDILFEKLQIHKLAGQEKPKRTGKTKQYATDVKILEQYRSLPVVDAILAYRQLTKLKSTYIDGLPPLVNPSTGRIHSTFSQTVAATGRLSSSNPNFQNIPIRTDVGREIRRAFAPQQKGWVLLSADYSQIELRVMAHMSGDPRLIQAFADDMDIHTSTASLVFDLPADKVTRDLRRKAKDINFGIMYGISPFGLASRIGMSQAEAREFIDNYFQKYPKVRSFIDQTLEEGKKNGYVTTLFGRRRFLPDLKSKNYAVRQNAERAAINTPIQGTAAELIKLAMIAIHRELVKEKMMSRMILQVHDELVFELPREELNDLESIVKNKMENTVQLQVPVRIDMGSGQNWLETK
jgi:DNA polymerase-1